MYARPSHAHANTRRPTRMHACTHGRPPYALPMASVERKASTTSMASTMSSQLMAGMYTCHRSLLLGQARRGTVQVMIGSCPPLTHPPAPHQASTVQQHGRHEHNAAGQQAGSVVRIASHCMDGARLCAPHACMRVQAGRLTWTCAVRAGAGSSPWPSPGARC